MTEQIRLSKEEELSLGTKIQKMVKVKNAMEVQGGDSNLLLVDGEEIDATYASVIIKEGKKAVEVLVACNTGLVWDRARAFKSKFPGALPLEELAQEGFAGLMKAVWKYDPTRGNKFSTMAYSWIGQSISRNTNETCRLVRLPDNRVQDYTEIVNLRRQYQVYDLTPAEIDELICDELNMSQQTFLNIINAGADSTSLNRVITPGESPKELIDFISEKEGSSSSEEFVMHNAIYELLNEKIGGLSELQKEVVASSFLVSSLSEKKSTTEQVREKYQLTPSKFKRILNESLNILKRELDDLGVTFEDFLEP